MNVSYKMVRGPVSHELLKAISLLYGKIDTRYKSVAFCSGLFNENPHGGSLHAFVFDDEKVIGHYALIPMWVLRGKEMVLSGKGEALYLEEGYRNAVISINGTETPAAWVLMRELNNYGLKNSMQLVHNYSPPDIGSFLRMIGFKQILIERNQYHLIFSPSEIPQIEKKYLFGVKILSKLQIIMLNTVSFLMRSDAVSEINSQENLESRISIFQKYLAVNNNSWSISADIETIKWMMQLNLLTVISLENNPDAFYILKQGQVMEILFISKSQRSLTKELKLLSGVLNISKKHGALIVSVNKNIAGQNLRIKLAVKVFLFFPKLFKSYLYVKSADKFFLKGENLYFSRLFNL